MDQRRGLTPPAIANTDELFAAIEKHQLTLTPSGTTRDKWVAYNNVGAGRGASPELAVEDFLGRFGERDTHGSIRKTKA